MTIDENCVADPPVAEIWYEPTDPLKKTQVLWIFTSIPAGGSAEIEAKPEAEQGPDGAAKRKMFKLKYKAFDEDDTVVASGKVKNPPPYPGGLSPVWKYKIKIVDPKGTGCSVDPGVCVRGGSGGSCEI